MTSPRKSEHDDECFMDAALALGRRGLGTTAPNPSVGALVVRDGIVVGRGVTAPGGRPHGETIALAQAGAAAVGATIYVTLEPCSHHGRTGPCCEAIVAAGVTRLVYALEDPDPVVTGGGAYCLAKGLQVQGGVRAEAARRDHRGHIRRISKGRPAVTLKLAETADGFVAGGPHDPRLAITGAASNGVVHVMRAMHDAIMVGVGTVLADDPLMTVRLPGLAAKPLRVVLDSELRIAPHSRLLRTAAEVPVLLMAGKGAKARAAALADMEGVEVAVVSQLPSGRLDLRSALALLAQRGITRVFSEGGPSVAASLIEGGFADDVLLFTAPRPLGGDGISTFSANTRQRLADPTQFRLVDERGVGADILRHYESVA